MRHVMVRYRVRPEFADENERLVRAVFAELQRARPANLRYSTFRFADGTGFVHVASTADGDDPLTRLEAFQRFRRGLPERCVQPPIVTELRPVGRFASGDEPA